MPISNPWAAAQTIAAHTPLKRNRYVDLLRASSIGIVVVGHWLISMPAIVDGELRAAELLRVAPWTQWLSWAFQVMPIFFIVGGYANAAAWKSAQRRDLAYGEWATARLQRLVGPVVPLLIFWTLLAIIARQLGMQTETIQTASRAAFIPLWFLAVYIMVVVSTPLTYFAWRRFGLASFLGLASIAVVIDIAAFAGGFTPLRWVNYAFVWLAVHQLGYLWRDGRLAGPAYAWPWAVGGLAALILLVTLAGYPISMISVPGAEVSNSSPPTVALLALGAFHAGLLLALEHPARAWLRRLRPWTVTILVNANIMTLYLWHITVMLLTVGIAVLLGGIGLEAAPGSQHWWWLRPVWIALLFVLTWGCVLVLAPFERNAKIWRGQALSAWRIVIAAVIVCSGLASITRFGIGDPGALGVRLSIVVWTLLGAALLVPSNPFRRQR
ncbi:MAG: acyltransferase [Granulosicoccaceae bacterium]|jgi:hypothetical protein